MIIETKTGKHKSKVTKRELQEDLRLRMSTLTPDERKYLIQILDEIIVAGDQVEESPPESPVDIENLSGLYRNLANLHYEREIVSVDHFIRSDEYMGNTGKSLYDQWLRDLNELYSRPYNEVIITGGIGTGKSTMAEFGLAYTFYQICMLRDPQASFGLMEGSEIILVCFNRDDYLARHVTFGGLKKKIESSPFFEKMGLKINDSSIKFEKKNIEIIAASAKSAKTLGRNVFGGIIDETDFIDGGSVLKDKELATGEKSIIELLHTNIIRRMKSRFDRAGVLPGKLFMTSSAKSLDSFTNRRIGEASTDPMVFCRDYAQYEVKPPDKFPKQRFWVRVGNERIPHKVLSRKEYQALGRSGRSKLEKNGCRFIRVPMNFKKDFERNIEDSIRDISGITTVSVMPFFQMRGRLYEMIDDTLVPPTRLTEWVQDEPLEINWKAITKRYRRRIGPGRYEEVTRPRRHPDAQRFVHIDLSRGVQDPTGIAIGHIVDYIQLSRRRKTGEEFTESLPLIEIDLVIRVVPAPGKEIDFGEVRGLIYDFQRHGYAITFAAMDSFQGHSMLQELAKHGIDGEILSVDKTVEPYTDCKTAIYEGRVSVYSYSILLGELEKLRRNDMAKVKIDHPPNGCFVGETRIPLLDGTCPEIKDLDGKEVEVYSCAKNGTIVPGMATGRFTKEVSELLDVVLDTGAVERCTPEHRWMLRDGSYKMAKDLIPGVDRLMPINRVWPVNGGYERLTNRNGARKLTHHMVAEHVYGRSLLDSECVHHVNGNKTDNRSCNLVIESKSKHALKHTLERHRNDEGYRKSLVVGLCEFNKGRGRVLHSAAIKRYNASLITKDKKNRARKNGLFRSDIVLESLISVSDSGTANDAARRLGCGRNVIIRVLKDNGFRSWTDFTEVHGGENHKVRYVIPVKLDTPVKVYDLEVNDYDNFALSSGVFVHNSKDVADAFCGVVYTLTTRQTMLGDISPGISEYHDRSEEDSEWIRSTMHKSGEKAPIEVKRDEDPIFFLG